MAFDPRVIIGPDGFPIFIEPIPVEELRALDPNNPDDVARAHEYMALYGWENPNQLRLRAGKALADFTVDPSSPNYIAQVDQVAAQVSGNTAVIAAARRAAEAQSTNAQAGGDYMQMCTYVTEDEPCPQCDALGGTHEPYAWFVANNARPGDQCYQGSSCRCDLVFTV
jgi:hypothetical protein